MDVDSFLFNEINAAPITVVAQAGHELGNPLASNKKETPIVPLKGDDEIDMQFEEFWKSFPGKAPPYGRKTDKADAKEAFRKIVTNKHRRKHHVPAAELVAAAKSYARRVAAKKDEDYVPVPVTWLNKGRWIDEEPAQLSGQNASMPWWKDPERRRTVTLERWREGIREHANGIWPTDKLGPAPGRHDCVVPAQLVSELQLEEIYTPAGIKRKPL